VAVDVEGQWPLLQTVLSVFTGFLEQAADPRVEQVPVGEQLNTGLRAVQLDVAERGFVAVERGLHAVVEQGFAVVERGFVAVERGLHAVVEQAFTVAERAFPVAERGFVVAEEAFVVDERGFTTAVDLVGFRGAAARVDILAPRCAGATNQPTSHFRGTEIRLHGKYDSVTPTLFKLR